MFKFLNPKRAGGQASASKSAATPVLQLQNVHKSYATPAGPLAVLQNVSLTLNPGESVAIVGASGSGKSTLLHIAGLLDGASEGAVHIHGQDTSSLTENARAALRNRTFGFVYQHHHLMKDFTALENVAMPAAVGGQSFGTAKQRAQSLLQAVGLGQRLHHLPSALSGGEQQRVAIARALANRPAALLADEPTGNLDPHTADAVADMLFNLVKSENMALLMVTHNPQLAARCTHTLTMHGGVLTQSGTPTNAKAGEGRGEKMQAVSSSAPAPAPRKQAKPRPATLPKK